MQMMAISDWSRRPFLATSVLAPFAFSASPATNFYDDDDNNDINDENYNVYLYTLISDENKNDHNDDDCSSLLFYITCF